MAALLEAPIEKPKRSAQPEPEEDDSGVREFEWTVPDFYRAIQAGVFKHPERLELINGEIFEKVSPQLTPHCTATLVGRDLLAEVFGPTFHVRIQMPLDITQKTEPEPDLFVVTGKTRDYEDRKPSASDVRLLVEVADTTLGYDRHRKAARYAEAGILDYWIVNLRARCVEVYREPATMPDSRWGHGYKVSIRYMENESVTPLALPEAKIAVADLLPSVKATSQIPAGPERIEAGEFNA